MKISEILKDIELTDEQVKALDEFFENFTNEIRESAADELRETIKEEVMEEVDVNIDDAEAAFNLFKSDCEKAFDSFEEDCEVAFEMFESDAEKAFDLGMNDAKKLYTENMTRALQDVYDDIEERVKADIVESQEFKAIEQIKNAVAPLILTEDQKAIKDELEELKAEKQIIEEEKEELNREKIIETLMKDFPEQYEETVRKFIDRAKNEDEIYERFKTVVEMIDADSVNIKTSDDIDIDDIDDINEEDEEEVIAEEGIFDVEKKDKETKESKREGGAINPFTEEDLELLGLAFPQVAPR